MSEGETEGGAPVVKRVYRTVTPPYRGRPDSEMTIIGLAYFAGLLVLLIPLLPFLIIVWLLGKLFDALRQGPAAEEGR